MGDVFGTSEQLEAQNVQPDSPTDAEALGYEEGQEPEATDRPEGPDNGHPSQDQPAQGTDGESQSSEGERLLGGKYKTPEELEQGYKNLQALYGRQAEELGRLRQEAQLLELMRQQGHQIPMPGYRQPGPYPVQQQPMAPTPQWPYGMPTAPQGIPPQQATPPQMAGYTPQVPYMPMAMPGQMAQNTPAQAQDQASANQPLQNEDPGEWLDKLYEQGPELIRQMVQAEAKRIIDEQGAILGQGLQQILSPVFQTTAQIQKERTLNQWKETFDSQIKELKEADKDFADIAPEMEAVIKRNPQILYSVDPQGKPNGMHVAYMLAKTMREQSGVSSAAKQAARMPSSSGSIVQKQNDNDNLVDAALGSLGESGGVFG